MKNFADQEYAEKMESRRRKRRSVNEGEILEFLDALDNDYSEHDDLGRDSGKKNYLLILFIHNILRVLSINNIENIDFLYFLYGFSSLCSYLYLDSLTTEVESDERSKR